MEFISHCPLADTFSHTHTRYKHTRYTHTSTDLPGWQFTPKCRGNLIENGSLGEGSRTNGQTDTADRRAQTTDTAQTKAGTHTHTLTHMQSTWPGLRALGTFRVRLVEKFS